MAAISAVGGGWITSHRAAESAASLYASEQQAAVTDWRREVYVDYFARRRQRTVQAADEKELADHEARAMLLAKGELRNLIPQLSDAAIEGNNSDFDELRQKFIEQARRELNY